MPARTDSPPDFNMETFHQSHEGADTAEAEVQPGTGPLSNEALGQRGDSTKPEVTAPARHPTRRSANEATTPADAHPAPGHSPTRR